MGILKINRFKYSASVLHLLLLFFAVHLTACSWIFGKKDRTPQEDDNYQSDASFIVDELKGGRVVATRINGLPEEIEISYKACFRDFVHNDQPLPLNVFNIYLFEGTSLKDTKDTDDSQCFETSAFNFSEDHSKVSCLRIRTEADGCLQWTEIYPYKMMNKSVWFRYERAFEGTGLNRGTVVVPLAVNPWLSLDRSGAASPLQVLDLRHHSKFRGQAVRLQQKDIAECEACANKKDNTLNCNACRQKKRSLSAVINHFSQQTGPPRLWINGDVISYVSQEHISLTKPLERHKSVLKQFRACHLEMQDNCDPPGRFFRVHLELPLRIQVRNHRNELELLPLNHGDYSVKPYLFLVDDKGNYLSLHRDMDFIPASLVRGTQNNNLRVDFYLHVPYENYSFQVLLGLKVEPRGDRTFLPFEGVFNFPGQYRTIIGQNTLPLSHNVLSFYEENQNADMSFIDTSYKLSGDPNLNKVREGFHRAGWNLELRRLRFSDVNLESGKCSSPVSRHIRYVGEVCIFDPLTGNPISDTNISIKRQEIIRDRTTGQFLDGQVTEIETMSSGSKGFDQYELGTQFDLNNNEVKTQFRSDTTGCVRWVDQMQHNWYNRQQYFVRKMIFSKKEWGFEGERMIAINPWHWGFVFFQDITQIGTDSIRTVADQVEKPRFVLHDFRSQFVEMVYTVDKWLGINVFQNLLFLFRVMVDRPDDVAVGLGGQRPSAKPVRRGYYLVRFILVKSHTEEAGGRGNMVMQDDLYKELYKDSRDHSWNTNVGWHLGRDNRLIGQMMNTNLEYITHFDTPVQIRDGIVNAYINFRFDLDEFIFIGSNNRVIVQILPTDPTYYSYHNGGCEIDPDRSIFAPYTDHELISQAFIGSFVPSDQRNWNIFRVLRNVPFQLSGSSSMDDIYGITLNKGALERFVEQGSKNSFAYQVFTKLQTTMNSRSVDIGDKAKMIVMESKELFEDVYQKLKYFITISSDQKGKSRRGNNFHSIEYTRNQLIGSIDDAILPISRIVNGSGNSMDISDFSRQILKIFQDTLKVFKDGNNSYDVLRDTAQQALNNYSDIITTYLPHLSEEEKNTLLSMENDQNKWFAPGTDIPEDPRELSAFNRDRFARSEGLKVLSFDEPDVLIRFVEDLNAIADIHNSYREQYVFSKSDPFSEWLGEWWNEWFGDEEEDTVVVYDKEAGEKNIAFRSGKYSAENDYEAAILMRVQQEHTQALQNNFPLLEGDNYYAFYKKIQQMNLPKMSPQWLRTVIEQGIRPGTLDTPEVMTFLHSMCGFWFNDFYEKYLEQYQLDAIYTDHLNHYQYYKGTLNYFLEEIGPGQQYQDLYRAMQEHSLQPMDERSLRVENPFLVYGLPELISGNTIPTGNVVESLYTGNLHLKDLYYKIASAEAMVGDYGVTPQTATNMLTNRRHPYFKCLSNPLNFFHVEKKIIIGDIGSDYSDLMYEYGQTLAFNVQQAFDYSFSASWGVSRGFSSSLGAGFVGGTGLWDKMMSMKFLRAVNPVLGFSGVKFSSEWSTNRSDSESNRRQQSERFAKALYMILNHSSISIALKQYRECMVIRTHNLAFDGYHKENGVWNERLQDNFIHQIPYIKSGLLICTENIDAEKDQKPMRISEDYFYIYQPNQGDRGQFLNPLNFLNRPYVISIRGVNELEKMEFLIHSFVEPDREPGVEDYNPERHMTNPFDYQPDVAGGTRRAIRQAKVWDKTGFYPGVYSVKYDNEHSYFRKETYERGIIEKVAEGLYDNNPLGFINFDDGGSVTRNSAPR